MTITWLNKNRVQQKAVINTLLDKLWQVQDTTVPATYIGTTAPEAADFNYAWTNKVGYTSQPIEGSPVQWFNPTKGVIEDHYTKVPEDNILSSGVYHQNGYVDPVPWSKHVATLYGDGVSTTFNVGVNSSDFPTNYREIVIVTKAMSITPSAGGADDIGVQKNGYSGNTHTHYYWSQLGTGTTTQTNATNTSMRAVLGLSKATQLLGGTVMVIPDYTGAREGRTIWVAYKATSFVPVDDATANNDLRVTYSGGRSALSDVIDSTGITILSGDGLAFAKGTVISVYVRNPIPS